MQLQHPDHRPAIHSKKIHIVCDAVDSPANCGSIFRLAEAFGVYEIIFCHTTPDLSSNRLKRTARHTLGKVRFRESATTTNTLKDLKKSGYTLVALEITASSISLTSVDKQDLKKVAIVIGNERDGIRDEVLNACDLSVHIPMYGANSSLNVAQALGIALYEVTREQNKYL